MGRRLPALCVALALAAAIAAPALAQDERVSLFSQMSYTAGGGLLVPAGEEGEGLDLGFHGTGAVNYETGSGIVMGLKAGYNTSGDDLRTRIAMLCLTARISPPDYTVAFLQLGAGGYHVSYAVDAPLARPESQFRPGGSFGLGFEVFTFGKFSLGGSAAYHGIILNRSDALSFVTASVDLIYRPYAF